MLDEGDYLLLKAIERVGSLKGRKRLQKLVYLAKLQGLPIRDRFYPHYYGPYSGELAARADDLVEAEVLEESRSAVGSDAVEYSYKLTDAGRDRLRRLDQKAPPDVRGHADKFATALASLADRDVFELELAATMAYWAALGRPWTEAEQITARRKNADPQSDTFRRARELAESVLTRRSS